MVADSEEKRAFRDALRRLIDTEINPHVEEWDAAGRFPAHEVFAKFGALGALGLEYDPAYGGGGVDHSWVLVLAEELGRIDAGAVPMALAVQALMATPALARVGSPELKERYLSRAISGEDVCSVAVTEPDAGSDVAAIRTRAVRDGDDWVITGRKMWITNGTQADWVVTLCRTSDDPGYGGMSLILVPTDLPGFSVSRAIKKMGNLASDTAELIYDQVRVPVANTIGEIGQGFYLQMQQFQDERLIVAYIGSAAARRALDRTKDYLQQRHAFGKPLLANQYLQYQLAELYAELDVLDGFLRHTVDLYVGGADVTRQATVAKLTVGRLVRKVADACVQFHGGMGYAEENWPARYYRDSRLLSIAGGADEVMLRIITMMEGMGKK